MSRRRLSTQALRWLECILAERFGHSWVLRYAPQGLELRLGSEEGCITFDEIQPCFHEARSDLPCTRWDAVAEGWSSVLGDRLPAPGVANPTQPLIEKKASGYVIHYDIFGLAYWMLARIEEIGRSDVDSHERFPASASHAYKQGYLQRPVVDEWFDILRQVIRRQWPIAELKNHHFHLELSHDVDRPSRYLFGPLSSAMRSAMGDALLRGDLLSPLRAIWLRHSSPHALHPADPFNTFEWLMDVSEGRNLQSTFYFMAESTNPQFDAKYSIGQPAIRRLLRCIHERGHQIGLHPSYQCFLDGEQIRREAESLWSVCEAEGIRQTEWGARMHFLRWRCPQTVAALSAIGLAHDATLGFADRVGFRCGTAYSYTFFDGASQSSIPIRIRPLTAMDVSIYGNIYNNLGFREKARSVMKKIIDNVRCVKGTFALLWHNSELNENRKKNLYRYIIQETYCAT